MTGGDAAVAAVVIVGAWLAGGSNAARRGRGELGRRVTDGKDRSPRGALTGRTRRDVSPSRGRLPPRDPQAPGVAHSARWAATRDLGALVVDGSCAPGRLPIGVLDARRGLRRRPIVVAAEASESLAVFGPTQSGKTSALAVPAILGWEGPVFAASVKTDLVRDTVAWRSLRGKVWCFDPSLSTGLKGSSWSPLAKATTWPGARRAAADLTEVAKAEGTTADGEFWYAMAAKLLAPLLLAAATAGRTMADVVRWVDTQEIDEVADDLEAAGACEALQAARATWLREERQRSSVYTTAEAVLEPFADAAGPRGAGGTVDAAGTMGAIDPEALLSGNHTVYACAPAHDQRRLRAVFAALAADVIRTALSRASRLARPLDPPLLVVLDEAANIAPLPDLDGLAATCAGHGVQLVTVWQDMAQLRARYGERAATVVNNHRAKLFLPGIADMATLGLASQLAGEEERVVHSVSIGGGGRTVTRSPGQRPLLPSDALRRLPPGRAILLYGALPPVRLTVRPWWRDPELAGRAAAPLLGVAGAASPRTDARAGAGRRVGADRWTG